MKFLSFTSIFSLILCIGLYSQVIRPVVTLIDDPLPANISHITADNDYYYTCTGGLSSKQEKTVHKINKYGILTGDLIKSYPFKSFNMRSIMYNKKDKHLYIATFDMKIYKILDLETGIVEECFKNAGSLYKNPKASPALDPNGKVLYVMDKGTITMYNFKDGKVIKTLSGFSYGEDNKDDLNTGKYGSGALAVSTNYIYTWDAHPKKKVIYVYDKDGNLITTVPISYGNWGFSLSYANGLVFVSNNGLNTVGYWNGYKLFDNE